MVYIKRDQWLERLKAGDKVIVSCGGIPQLVVEVEKITPMGMIKLMDGATFSPRGYLMRQRPYDDPITIHKATSELVKQIQNSKPIRKAPYENS